MRSKKAVYNIITSLILQAIIFLSGFVIRKLIIQEYGSDINGLIASITQFLAYITLLESGIGPVIKATLYKPISKKDINQVNNILYVSEKFFRKIAKIFLLYIVVLSIIYPIIVKAEFGYLFTATLIIIIAISTFAEYYFGMTYKLLLQADQKAYIASIIQIIGYIFNLVFVVVLVRFNCNIHILKLITSLVFLIRPIIQNCIVKKIYKINLKDTDKDYTLKQKWDGLAQHIAAVIHGNTDVTILTFASSLKYVSIYSVYATVTTGVRLIIQSFSDGIEAMFGNMLAKDEKNNLKEKFGIYEIVFFTIVVIIYSCSFILITPFVKVYTLNITDVYYCNSIFGYLLVLGELVWAIRQPYNNLIKSAGHFKETRIGAWIEAIVNIILSVILVNKYGLVGIALGTLIAMLIRTVEFIYHVNKNILFRNILASVKKIFVLFIEFFVIIFASKYIQFFEYTSYINWGINAVCVLVLSVFISVVINILLYKNEREYLVLKIKKFGGKINENK